MSITYRFIHPEEALQAAKIEQLCFPADQACTIEQMVERAKVAPDFFLVAVAKDQVKETKDEHMTEQEKPGETADGLVAETINHTAGRREAPGATLDTAGGAVTVPASRPDGAATLGKGVNLPPAAAPAMPQVVGYLNGVATSRQEFSDEFYANAGLHEPRGANVMLCGLAVLPSYRGQGVARALMQKYQEHYRERTLILECLADKIPMYQGMGFELEGKSSSSWGGETWYEMRWEKQDHLG